MTAPTTMCLDHFPTLRATSFDQVRGLLATKGMHAEPTGPGERASLNAAYRPGWYLAHMTYDMPLRIDAESDRDDYTLYLPVSGGVRVSDGREIVECDRRRTVVASPDAPLVTWTTPGARRFNLTLSRDLLRRHLAALTDDDHQRLPQLHFALDRDAPAVRGYLRYLWGVIEALEHDPGFLDQPLVGAAVEQALAAGLLLAQQDKLDQRLTQPGAGPAPADVKRALDYLHANLTRDVTLGDLARVAGTPARTLQEHFRARFGCGPMRYLRDRRLCRAREELRDGDPTVSVTDVALRWGFGNLGRFAACYRQRFGENPSETLRDSRK